MTTTIVRGLPDFIPSAYDESWNPAASSAEIASSLNPIATLC
jgi:hypothetical protein